MQSPIIQASAWALRALVSKCFSLFCHQIANEPLSGGGDNSLWDSYLAVVQSHWHEYARKKSQDPEEPWWNYPVSYTHLTLPTILLV